MAKKSTPPDGTPSNAETRRLLAEVHRKMAGVTEDEVLALVMKKDARKPARTSHANGRARRRSGSASTRTRSYPA